MPRTSTRGASRGSGVKKLTTKTSLPPDDIYALPESSESAAISAKPADIIEEDDDSSHSVLGELQTDVRTKRASSRQSSVSRSKLSRAHVRSRSNSVTSRASPECGNRMSKDLEIQETDHEDIVDDEQDLQDVSKKRSQISTQDLSSRKFQPPTQDPLSAITSLLQQTKLREENMTMLETQNTLSRKEIDNQRIVINKLEKEVASHKERIKSLEAEVEEEKKKEGDTAAKGDLEVLMTGLKSYRSAAAALIPLLDVIGDGVNVESDYTTDGLFEVMKKYDAPEGRKKKY